ncbi:sodium- and chloride-dependent glycine transporter 1-like [Argonauta hians]
METTQSKPKLPTEDESKKDSERPEEEPEEVINRGNWDNKVEFLLTCIGYSVGLGNVWRFPYLVFKNGGGAFLIPYWFMQLFVGIPLFFMELSFGQFASLGPITIWRSAPLLKGFGYALVLCTFYVTLYYNVIITYCFTYLFSSMSSPLPYSYCNQQYASHDCYDGNTNTTLLGSVEDSNSTSVDNRTITPSEQYFNHGVLNKSSGIDHPGTFQWKLTLNLLLAWIVVFVVLVKGIKSLGKVVYFTAIFPYLVLLALLIRGSTLEGSLDGVKYYLYPKWSRLADSTVWGDAATQVFFSLSIASGGLITMASYNKFSNNCLRDAIIVPLIDCFTSFFSGFVIFTVLGFMAHVKGVSVEAVVKGGPGLAFVAYPEAITKMPSPTVWAILFFLMMLTIGFSSQFSLAETVMSSLMDEWQDKLRRNWKTQLSFRTAVCSISFLLGLPMTTQAGMYILYLMDSSVSGFPLLFLGLTECLIISYVYGYHRFSEDLEMMLGRKPSLYWRICWTVITPLILAAVMISKAIQYKTITLHDYDYPRWAQIIGWLLIASPIVLMVLYIIVKYCKDGAFRVLVDSLKPLPNWGPAESEDRTGRYSTEETNNALENVWITEPLGENMAENESRRRFSDTDDVGMENEGFDNDRLHNSPPHYNRYTTTTTNSRF